MQNNSNMQEPSPLYQSGSESSRNIESFLTLQMKLPPKKQNETPIDTRASLVYALLILSVEQLVYFAFQIISYTALNDFWVNSRWITGTILFISYLMIVAALVFVAFRALPTPKLFLKLIEFLLCFFLLGWAGAFIDFALISLSYLVLLNAVILAAAVHFRISLMFVIIAMAIFLLIDSLMKVFLISQWYFTVPVLVFVSLRLISLNYCARSISELNGIHSPQTYLFLNFEFSLHIYVEFFINKQMAEHQRAKARSVSANEP